MCIFLFQSRSLLVEGFSFLLVGEQDLTEAYEEKLDDEKITINQLKLEEEQALKDFSEIRRQHEEDQDKEIEDTKAKYSIWINQEFKRFF